MVKGKDGLYYVPNILTNKINVMELQPNLMLKEVAVICVGMPIDNLSVDRDGNIWAAGIPKALDARLAFEDPFNFQWSSTIWRIRKLASGKGYEVKKILEDRDARFVAGVTTAVHDAKTGRIFTSGRSRTGWYVTFGLTLVIGALTTFITVYELR